MTEIAVVVGVSAANGSGGAIAGKFTAAGLHVVIAGRTGQRLATVVDDIKASGGDASYCVADATDAAALKNLMDQANALGTVNQ